MPRRLPLLKSPTEVAKGKTLSQTATPAGGEAPAPRKPASGAGRTRSGPPSRPRSSADALAATAPESSSSRGPEIDINALKTSFLDEAHPEAVLALIEQAKIKREREAERAKLAATQAAVRETLLKQVCECLHVYEYVRVRVRV